ncbi:hypothetical protein FHS00_001270 [Limimaricola variabilis]|uniref:DUF4864 domain-containing protein n=1 Tax=Limimaricola variabilis TaxID=1492771 RepID=A0ABR6HMC5_9RHOB|nr:DUF4864 domain-containing protein [Limimaricola variabilis]MBB3711699.1 hypothetical protein [Limimaricola variabilis]WPY94465.1 DUF4864 domain-containing protein [Limimaricola variabilis]
MRTKLVGLVLALVVAGAALAQQGGAQDAIRSVIEDQLGDFTARDVEGAYDHASDTIQNQFGNADTFGRMVKQGYPMVWDNDSARFLDLEEREGVWFQRVLIRDGRGVPHLLDYRMIETAEGWRIDGVMLLAGPEFGV